MRPSLERLALFARRRYRLVFAAVLAVSALAGALASRLQFDTDVLALLPRHEPALVEFRQALEDFGSLDYLMVVVRIPEGALLDPYEAYVDLLGERLTRLAALRQVEYRLGTLDDLLQSFLPSSLLFLERADLERVAARLTDEALAARAAELRRTITMPQSLVLKDLMLADPFGVADIFLERLEAPSSGLSMDLSRGYFASEDRRLLLLLAQPVAPAQDVDFSRRLVAEVEREIEAATEAWRAVAAHADFEAPEVELGGRHVIGIGDERLIRRDVVANISTSLLGVLALFLVAFRRLGPLVYAAVPLLCGLVLTFGAAALSFGRLNAATSGTAALLIGLGIDFVIVSYGRFVEERSAGADLERALSVTSGSSGRAVLVGGVTSAATFYAFAVTDFTGLRQMGLLTGTGILLCMGAVLLLLPAMLAWREDHHRRRRRPPRHFLHAFGAAPLIRTSMRRPLPVLAAGIVVTLLAAVAALELDFDDSVQSMRPRGNRGVEVRDEVAERFGIGFDQMMLVLRAESAEAAVELAERATRDASALMERGILRRVDGVGSLLPARERQQAALSFLAAARRGDLDPGRIRTSFLAALAAEGVRAEAFVAGVDRFLGAIEREEPLAVAEIEADPQGRRLLGRYLHGDEHGWKSVVYLHPPPRAWRREAPPEAHALAASLGSGAALTGANVISNVLRARIFDDARTAGLLGLALVAAILWADYRRLLDAMTSLVPLAVGVVWMLGAMAALGMSMNFMNIFVTTMIIGVGVDYGVHMMHRYREFAGSSRALIEGALEQTGKAVVLAALSTLVGFGSLARSHYPGLASMGVVAILGALSTCLVSITLLPAFLSLRLGRRRRKEAC